MRGNCCHTREQAIRLASVQRLRPKLMTASCAALGLVTSTLFTLLVLPAVYLLVERAKDRFSK